MQPKQRYPYEYSNAKKTCRPTVKRDRRSNKKYISIVRRVMGLGSQMNKQSSSLVIPHFNNNELFSTSLLDKKYVSRTAPPPFPLPVKQRSSPPHLDNLYAALHNERERRHLRDQLSPNVPPRDQHPHHTLDLNRRLHRGLEGDPRRSNLGSF